MKQFIVSRIRILTNQLTEMKRDLAGTFDTAQRLKIEEFMRDRTSRIEELQDLLHVSREI